MIIIKKKVKIQSNSIGRQFHKYLEWTLYSRRYYIVIYHISNREMGYAIGMRGSIQWNAYKSNKSKNLHKIGLFSVG